MATVYDFEFYFQSELDPLTVFQLEAWGDEDEISIRNFTHDEETGIVTFDYTFQDDTGNKNSTDNPLTITGSFNSGQKIYSDMLYKKSK